MESVDQYEPHHSKFFDVITLPVASTDITEVSSKSSSNTSLEHQIASMKYNVSIMCYEDAILTAIQDLKDTHGSSVMSIKKHIQSNLLHENSPKLLQSPDALPLQSFLEDLLAPAVWNEPLFLQALKSLMEKHCIDHSKCSRNGSTLYKLSPDYKKNQTLEMHHRMERLATYKASFQATQRLVQKEQRKEAPAHVPILKKGHLVEPKAVVIMEEKKRIHEKKKKMDIDINRRNIGSILPHSTNVHVNTMTIVNGASSGVETRQKRKSLREKNMIPRHKLVVSQILSAAEKDDDDSL